MSEQINVTLRECRMVLERILLQTRIHPGSIAAVREHILRSELRGLGGFAGLLEQLPELQSAHLTQKFELADRDTLTLNAKRQHAWVVGQPALDLLLSEAALSQGIVELVVHNLTHARELSALHDLALRLGATVTVREGVQGAWVLRCERAGVPLGDRTDPLLWGLIRNGLALPATLWWRMYQLSLGALAPDNVVSRRHAGANIVTEDGRIVGRPSDDDTDFSMLKAAAA
jgi:hypothetical protein